MKKIVYLSLSVLLGAMLSVIAHSIIEKAYLGWMEQNSLIVAWSSGCALPSYLSAGLLIFGIVGGFYLGQIWWRIVYIEKRRWGWGNK